MPNTLGSVILCEHGGLVHVAIVFHEGKSYLVCASEWFEEFDENQVSKKELVTCLKCLSGVNRAG